MGKHILRIHLIIYSLFWMAFPVLRAQEGLMSRYNVTYITMDEGLPHNFVDDIYKDSRGFLWISMQGGGLARYDGHGFIRFSPNTPHCQLQSNFINKVQEDGFQRLWAVSEGGIDIIDLTTLQEVPLLESVDELKGTLQQPTSYVLLDATGCIWLHCTNRLCRISFDTRGDIADVRWFESPHLLRNDITLGDPDRDGNIWVGLYGQLYRITTDTQNGLQASPIDECLTFEPTLLFTDFLSVDNEVWISTDKGLLRYDRLRKSVKRYEHIPGQPHSLSQNHLSALALTDDNLLLVASLRGINIYNPEADNFEHIGTAFSSTGTSLLNSDFVNCITTDGKHIWIGTESGGINKLTGKRLSIQNYLHDPKNPHTLSRNPVNAIYEASDGTLWVGTVEGGLNRKAPDSDRFTHYTHEGGALSHNSVSIITADAQQRLWVGTWGGGVNLIDPKHPQKPLRILSTDNGAEYPIDFVGALVHDSINNGLWIGANHGIYFYDLGQQQLLSPLPGRAAESIRGCIGSLIDQEGKLWMGCLDGVYIIDLHARRKTGTETTFDYRHLKYKLDDPKSGLIEKITCLYQTADGTLWLGSNGYGLYKRTTDSNGGERFTAYTTAHGLPNNCIRGIQEDSSGCLWIATYNGLSRLMPGGKSFVNYTRHDGLASTQFYWNAACQGAANGLCLGSISGLSVVTCDLSEPSASPAPVRFTRLVVGNEEVVAGSRLLPQDISATREITIHEREKSFSLEFAALTFEPDDANAYNYRLVGFDKKWIKGTDGRRFASYTNLSPGHYKLQVRYTPDKGEEQTTELEIFIQPYFYKTLWFILLVIVLGVAGVWQFYQWRVRNFKRLQGQLHRTVDQRTYELSEQKKLLETQTEELSRQNRMLKQQNEKITRQKEQLTQMARKIQELTLDKIAFFTNITHEFRTPITLIIGPIERALKLSYNPQVIEQLHFVERNSKYLLSLVNQLMDFRKVESGKLEIVKRRGNFLKFANELVTPFEIFAHDRHIQLKSYFRMATPEIVYDEEAMHKVLTNLLSNAVKFTPDGGSVSLFIALLPPVAGEGARLYLCVSDTGCGIPTEDTDSIFNRFYQSKGQAKYPVYGQTGSGIGLYLCKRIVQMHGGTIHARNNPRTGCSLRILLPLTDEESHATVKAISPTTDQPADNRPTTDSGKKDLCVLIVEDNADMRGYIRSILREHYNVAEAANGEEALRVLNTQQVDFIVSDLMMPVMDGMELSRRVKENIAISHIPFLMLTAKTSQESRIEGYRMGVDEYLLKPFDETLLLTRIENILENRKRYQRTFALKMDVEALHIDEESGDKKFINRVMEVVKEQYRNPLFEVTDFCEAVGVSKTLLNQKLQSLVGQSPAQFIRNYRLNLARDLILKNRGNKEASVSEIAYECGFNDPKYFTRCFTKEFHTKPSELLNSEEPS